MLWAENELINTPRSGVGCLIHSSSCKKAVLDMVFGTMTYEAISAWIFWELKKCTSLSTTSK